MIIIHTGGVNNQSLIHVIVNINKHITIVDRAENVNIPGIVILSVYLSLLCTSGNMFGQYCKDTYYICNKCIYTF